MPPPATAGSVPEVELAPGRAPGFGDALRLGGIAETAVAGGVEVLAVVAVEQVVDARGQLQVFVQAVAAVEREHRKTRTRAQVAADHVALAGIAAVLVRGHAQQRAPGPVALLPAGAQARLQRRHLRQRALAGATPGIGQRAAELQPGTRLPIHAQFATGDVRVQVPRARGAARHPAGQVVEHDVVVDPPGIDRGPGLEGAGTVLQAGIELGGALRLHAGEGIGRALRPHRGREQLPVVRHALGMAEAGIPAEAPGHVVLVAQEAPGEGLLAAMPGGRVGHGRHAAADLGAAVRDAAVVHAQAGHQVVDLVDVPVRFGEHSQAAGTRVMAPRRLLPGAAAHGAAPTVLALPAVDAGGQLPAVVLEGQGHASAFAGVADVAGHRHGHGRARIRVAQAVVVHHVVDLVAVEVGHHRLEHAAHVLLFKAQAEAVATELRAVHAAAGVTGLRVAGAGGQFQHGVGIGGPADGCIGIPLVPGRWHAAAIAAAVVVGSGAVAARAEVAARGAGAGVQHLVVAAVAAGQDAALRAQAGAVEVRDLAFKAHRAGRGATAPQHGLRTLDHGQAVVGLRRDVG